MKMVQKETKDKDHLGLFHETEMASIGCCCYHYPMKMN